MDWSEFQNWDEYTKLLKGLLFLADPIGVLPVMLGFTKAHSLREQKSIIHFASITFIIALTIFSYLGGYIWVLFGITTVALYIAGGILSLFYSLEMLGGIQLPHNTGRETPQDSRTLGAIVIYAKLARVPNINQTTGQNC
jgi:small neutral amino acid transporter SnatA (MarC family)